MILADSTWTEPATIIGFGGWIVGIVGLLLAGLTYMGIFPRRSVAYGIAENTRLIQEGRSLGDSVKILHLDQELTNPRIVTLRFANRSRRDIDRTSFDGQHPIVFNLGSPVLEILDVSSVQGEREVGPPEFTQVGATLSLGPCLIRPRQVIQWSLLMNDDPNLSVDCRLSGIKDSLVDFELEGKAGGLFAVASPLAAMVARSLLR